jgi:molybdate transport system substrate-binding protein
MKRAFTAGLAVLIACSAAAGRNGSTITVAAAASLTQVFEQIGAAFERAHPDIDLRFTFGASDGLASQIASGAPVDVFASAAPRWVDAVAKDPGIARRAVFARNHLVVIVPRDNPAHISSFTDLGQPRIKVTLASSGVPAGDYARQAFARAHISLRSVVSGEADVEAVVQKVVLGEADAGVVYATDLTPAVARSVRAISLPPADDVFATDEIAIVKDTLGPRAFLAFVLGPGASTLRAAGFLPPA